MPAASPESLFGSVWVPADGFLDPHTATYALADAARSLGARIRTGERVTAIELASGGGQGRQDGARAGSSAKSSWTRGIWAPRVASMAGVRVPVDARRPPARGPEGRYPARSSRATCRASATPTGSSTGSRRPAGSCSGGTSRILSLDGSTARPGSTAAARSLPTWTRFEQLLRGAARRFPFIADAEIVKLVCHPDAMTPDANPLVGPAPTVRGLWFAAGLSLNGFGAAGGLGRALAGWIAGTTRASTSPRYRPWRFGGSTTMPAGSRSSPARPTATTTGSVTRSITTSGGGRNGCRPCTVGLQDAGAVFQAKHGWERPERFEPGEPWRRAGPDQRAFGWSVPRGSTEWARSIARFGSARVCSI